MLCQNAQHFQENAPDFVEHFSIFYQKNAQHLFKNAQHLSKNAQQLKIDGDSTIKVINIALIRIIHKLSRYIIILHAMIVYIVYNA